MEKGRERESKQDRGREREREREIDKQDYSTAGGEDNKSYTAKKQTFKTSQNKSPLRVCRENSVENVQVCQTQCHEHLASDLEPESAGGTGLKTQPL